MLADILGYEPRTGAAPGPASSLSAASMSSRVATGAEPPLRPLSSRGDASGRYHREHRGHRSSSVAARACRAAGAFILAALALSAFGPTAEAQRPADVAGFTATASTTDVTITLSWNAVTNSGGGTLTGYEIQRRRESSDNWIDAPATSTYTVGTVTSITLTPADGLGAGLSYDFRMRSVSDAASNNKSFFTANQTATVLNAALVPPGAPGLLQAEFHTPTNGVPSGSVRLSWAAPSNVGNGGPITDWEYQYWRRDGSRNPGINSLGSSATFEDFPEGIVGQTYQFRAVSGSGDGAWSERFLVARPPDAPTGLRAEFPTSSNSVPSGDIRLRWNAPSNTGGSPITDYQYIEKRPGESFSDALRFRSIATSRIFPESIVGFIYRVRAVNSVGEGAWSEEFLVPDPNAPDPGTPTVTLVLTPARIAESGAGNSATLRATLSAAVSGSATTITVGANPASAVNLSGSTLTIPAGQTESSGAGIIVTAVDNDVDAPDARVTISGTVTETGRAGPAAVTLTITDDDGGTTLPPPPPPPPPGGDTGSSDGGLPPANSPATGAPAITGTAQVGQTLTAGRGTIADADGLASVSFAWRWIRVGSGGTERAIPGATNATYQITDADLGRTLKVRASFTDDAGNTERQTSAATATVIEDAHTVQVTTAVEGALAAVTRRAVSSALDTIGSRLTASMSASSLTLAGETVSPGAATTMAGLAPPCPPGAVDAQGVGTAFGAARFGAAADCVGTGRIRGLATADLLGGSAFSLALGVAEGSAGFDPKAPRWSLWGRGDLGSFEGRPEPGMRYDGDLTTGWLGVDARAGAWVAGVAVSHGTGDATYAFEDAAAGAGQGRLETSLTAIYPYGRWTVTEGLELRGVFGAGQGEARHGLDDDPEAISDLSMQMASIGVRHALPALAGIDLAARADMHVARLETDDGPDYIHGLTADSWRARAGLEASRHIVLDGDAALTPFVEAAARRDGGDGLEGTGLEVAGGLRYTAPRLELEARGRWLAAHSKDGAEEQGVSLTARVGPGAQGRGLSLALNPRWGAATGGAGALWREELPTAAGTPAGAALDARVGYGVVLPPYGLLTPFALTGLAEADRRRIGLGVRFAAPHLHFDVEVAGEHREGGVARPEQVLGIDLGLQF